MKKKNEIKMDYIDELGFYVIEDYDKKAPFASFLSGIAGVEGIPMWSFYVNRGQGISSIGIRDKSNCIMEFFPANEAYKMVFSNGFRTFIKVINNEEEFVFEPFSMTTNENIKRIIKIKNNELRLIEINSELNLNTEITYFTIPNEEFSALGRKVEVINTSNKKIKIEILDGLTAILPYGSDNGTYKAIGNTLRSYMQGEIKEDGTAMYKLRSSTEDSTQMGTVENSYFYVAFDENEDILNPIVDSEKIFGYDTSLKEPVEFKNNTIGVLLNTNKTSYNKVPCGFTGKAMCLEGNNTTCIYSYIGYMNNSDDVKKSLKKICNKNYFHMKINESNELIDAISKHVDTKTTYPLFDEYVKQCYIDNVLRGGYPLEFGNVDKKIYYVYSRKHGDLERDYNFFSIEPNFYSQGNGNFRDVNQNRRMDAYIHPFTGVENIKLFNDLIQLDGYNPLVIKGKKFYVVESKKENLLNLVNVYENKKLIETLDGKFTIGELYSSLRNIKEIGSKKINEIMNDIIEMCSEAVEVDFGEGFWSDHWTYNLDLIEEYLDVYPDKIKELLIKDESYKFYNSPEYVLPRKGKYSIQDGKVRQYAALAKKENISDNWIFDSQGNLYKTNLFAKLLILAGIKFMTLDPMGFGIEMEAGKPGWNDAMNGLPGLLGSSFSETAELKRLLLFVRENLDVVEDSIKLPEEFYKAIYEVEKILSLNLNEELSQLEYWDKISTIREEYREKIQYSISGNNSNLEVAAIESIINKMISKIDLGIEKAKNMNEGNIPTFMYYDVAKYEIDDKEEIKPLEFQINFLPSFLEGPTRYFKTKLENDEKHQVYKAVKESNVYDKKLKMYKTSESLEDVSFEIGRARSFTAGWLERESVFMHMEFKYILELIKNGLYEEFFEDIKTAMPPFMNPEVYGRSILENSSFIASSSNPDERTHGRGFVARLSGTTVEMLNIWKLMMVGEKLFAYEDGILKFRLNPILTKDFFKDSALITTILGNIKLIYTNINNKNTFGQEKGIIEEINLVHVDNSITKIKGNEVCGEFAEKIRNGEIVEIQATIL
ncbi:MULTISPECIES: hypothetical protein [unclassified Clostridium]|uniref:hypothetical protein n=1 Tax=unclassified Clostridium TaxID=2614128 RepID=UPI000297F1F8|nr:MULTISPECIES: hypothetical protein [unclassified Clostridium]EKQ50390.1 MAG: hypothetical protein A370_05641 [Clostridium sp. Maddingley MBC34-26]